MTIYNCARTTEEVGDIMAKTGTDMNWYGHRCEDGLCLVLHLRCKTKIIFKSLQCLVLEEEEGVFARIQESLSGVASNIVFGRMVFVSIQKEVLQ